MKLVSRQAGRELAFDIAAQVQNLGATVASNRLRDLSVSFAATGDSSEFKRHRLQSCRVELGRQGQPVGTVTASGAFDPTGNTNDITASADLFLSRLLAIVPQPGWEVSSGRAQMNTKVAQRGAAQTVSGTFGLGALTGRHGEMAFTNLEGNATFDIAMPSANVIDVQRFGLTLSPTAREIGRAHV